MGKKDKKEKKKKTTKGEEDKDEEVLNPVAEEMPNASFDVEEPSEVRASTPPLRLALPVHPQQSSSIPAELSRG